MIFYWLKLFFQEKYNLIIEKIARIACMDARENTRLLQDLTKKVAQLQEDIKELREAYLDLIEDFNRLTDSMEDTEETEDPEEEN